MAAADLPSELLYAIFEECAALAHKHDVRPWQTHICKPRCLLDWIYVTHVCRHWRATAFAWSPLWTCPTFVSKPWVNDLVSRSGTLPISISTIVAENGWGTEVILENLGRIKELVLEISDTLPLEEILDVIGESHPRDETVMLESLSITCVHGDTADVLDLSLGVSLANARNLRRLHLNTVVFSFPFMALDGMQNLVELSIASMSWFDGPEGQVIHLPRLARLHVTEGWIECNELLEALRYSNPLQYLGSIVALNIFRRCKFEDDASASVLSTIFRSLPNLASFMTCRTRLSNIVFALLPYQTSSKVWLMPAPRLRELSLFYIDYLNDIKAKHPKEHQARHNLPACPLSKCLAYRSTLGSSLERLSLTHCASIDEDERATLRSFSLSLIEDDTLTS